MPHLPVHRLPIQNGNRMLIRKQHYDYKEKTKDDIINFNMHMDKRLRALQAVRLVLREFPVHL